MRTSTSTRARSNAFYFLTMAAALSNVNYGAPYSQVHALEVRRRRVGVAPHASSRPPLPPPKPNIGKHVVCPPDFRFPQGCQCSICLEGNPDEDDSDDEAEDLTGMQLLMLRHK